MVLPVVLIMTLGGSNLGAINDVALTADPGSVANGSPARSSPGPSTVPPSAVLPPIVQPSAVQPSAVQPSAVQPSAVQPSTAPTSTAAPSAAPAAPEAGAEDPSCGGQPTLVSGGTTYQCTFDSEFEGDSLDTSQWQPVLTATSGYTSGDVACFVNSPQNISVGNGYLSLTVREVSAPFTCDDPLGNFTTQYTSGYVTTDGLFTQTYGRVEVMAKVPATTVAGLQSAFWLYPQNGGAGEMDIAETYSDWPGLAIPYLHYSPNPLAVDAATDTNTVTSDACTITPNQFNDYVIEWSPTTVTVTYNGTTCLVDNYSELLAPQGTPFDQPMFINLTQALGIGSNNFNPATTPLPATTEIKYVRVWQAQS
ncbi:MAG: family 16 glycosylhydrolase [Acidimicrobiales bacterium]